MSDRYSSKNPPEHKYEKHYTLKAGDVFVEGGSYVGRWADKASSIVGTKGRVIAIEPSPPNLEHLRRNVGGLANVTIVEKALWSKKGRAEFWAGTPSNFGLGHSLKATGRYSERYSEDSLVEVEIDVLDNILSELGIQTVNLLAWDIEGSEMHALNGTSKYLKSKAILNLALCFYHLPPQFATDASSKLESFGYHAIEYDMSVLYARVK